MIFQGAKPAIQSLGVGYANGPRTVRHQRPASPSQPSTVNRQPSTNGPVSMHQPPNLGRQPPWCSWQSSAPVARRPVVPTPPPPSHHDPPLLHNRRNRLRLTTVTALLTPPDPSLPDVSPRACALPAVPDRHPPASVCHSAPHRTQIFLVVVVGNGRGRSALENCIRSAGIPSLTSSLLWSEGGSNGGATAHVWTLRPPCGGRGPATSAPRAQQPRERV